MKKKETRQQQIRVLRQAIEVFVDKVDSLQTHVETLERNLAAHQIGKRAVHTCPRCQARLVFEYALELRGITANE